jgi:hypothetical protein
MNAEPVSRPQQRHSLSQHDQHANFGVKGLWQVGHVGATWPLGSTPAREE